MGRSMFRYNLSRPYPFSWFTYMVIIGGIALVILFSMLNFAANAYELKVHYTMDPNSTSARHDWPSKPPFNWLGTIEGSCTAREIFLGSTFYTDKLALPYTLDRVSSLGENDRVIEAVPSLSYMNNRLEDCKVWNMQIELLAEDRTAAQFGYAQWGPKIAASISCITVIENGRMMINLSTEYDLLPPTIENGQQTTLLQNSDQHSSLWWGESLISAYWIELSQELQKARSSAVTEKGQYIRKGSINLSPTENLNFSSLAFFNTHYHFIFNSEQNESAPIWVDQLDNQGNPVKFKADGRLASISPIWDPIDRYGKSFYSTILADLGQDQGPNLLLPQEEGLLQSWTEIFDSLNTDEGMIINAKMGPATASYGTLKESDELGKLFINSSTIHSQYLCQLPHRRPWGHLIIAILVADLVFLRFAWTCTNFAATWYLEKKDGNAMCCEHESHALQQVPDGLESSVNLRTLFDSQTLKLPTRT